MAPGVATLDSAQAALAAPKLLGKVLSTAINTNSDQMSDLQEQRLAYDLVVPDVLKEPHVLVDGEERTCVNHYEQICTLFPNLTTGNLQVTHLQAATGAQNAAATGRPLRVGLVLSGGQAAGGHNVIFGLFNYLRHRHPGSALLGFLNGPRGVLNSDFRELQAEELARYVNQGGFHLLGSGRDKIEKPEQLAQAAAVCAELKLDGLVVVGGDDSNTNAAVIAEYFMSKGSATRVIGVPKTLDGDLKNGDVAISFGFDTACKVYSEMIGNIMMDAASAKKYWHFVRLMGRAASHVTLECALQTHPQWAFISEEIASEGISMKDVAKKVADIVAARAAAGRSYGVILLPEGLVEYVHDIAALISELNDLMANGLDCKDLDKVCAALSPACQETFRAMSVGFQREFLEDRDPHGNVQVSHIESEKLLIRMVEAELEERSKAGTFVGKFNGLPHFFGYEGRCSLPSNFDCTYCCGLGAAAGALVGAGRTGLMATVSDLHLPAAEWRVGGVPLVSMMHMEHRSGKEKPVIRKALVDLDDTPMQAYRTLRDHWALHDCFRSPGPIQFQGHSSVCDTATITLALEINGGDPIVLTAAPTQ